MLIDTQTVISFIPHRGGYTKRHKVTGAIEDRTKLHLCRLSNYLVESKLWVRLEKETRVGSPDSMCVVSQITFRSSIATKGVLC